MRRRGQQAVSGFWAVLEGLIPDSERARVACWREHRYRWGRG